MDKSELLKFRLMINLPNCEQSFKSLDTTSLTDDFDLIDKSMVECKYFDRPSSETTFELIEEVFRLRELLNAK